MSIEIFKVIDFLKSDDEVTRLSGTGENDCGWSALSKITSVVTLKSSDHQYFIESLN